MRQRRRPADRLVPGRQLGELLRRRRPAPADVGVVGLDVGRRARRPVGHQDDAGRHVAAVCGVDEVDDRLQHARVGRGEHAVAEVEDVAGMATVVGEDLAGGREGDVRAGQHQRGIEVALQDGVGAQAPAGLGDRGPPVEADHAGPGRPHGLQQMVAPDAEVDRGGLRVAGGEVGEHPPRVGQDEALVVAAGERPGPRIEELERLGPVGQLDVEERDGDRGEAVHQVVPQRFVGAHEGLGVLVGAARPALDEVAGHRERGAGEPEHRHVGAELGGDGLHGFGDVPDGGGVERREPVEIGAAAQRLLDDRSGAGGHVDAEAGGVDRHDDVAVEDGGVDAVAPNRLQGDLRRQLGPADHGQDRAGARAPLRTRAGCARPGA